MKLYGDLIYKAQDTPEQYLKSSLQILGGMGTKGVRHRQFNYAAAVGQFRSWAYAAAMMNAWGVATVPLRLYARKRGGEKLFRTRGVDRARARYLRGEGRSMPSLGVVRKAAEWGDEFEQVTDEHPLTKLLTRPNPYMDGQLFILTQMVYLQLTGNAYSHPVVEKADFDGEQFTMPYQLWCMPPQYVDIKAAEPKTGDLIAAYRFGVNTAVARDYMPDEVIHAKLPNPKDPMFYGLGKVEAGWDCLKIDVAQRETDQSLFDNGARPDYAVIVKNGTQTQLTMMQEELNRVFRGTQRSGQPMLLTGDTQIFPLQWMPKDLGDREIITEEIAAVFGVPVSMLKANDPNLASAQVGFSSWRENTILPYCLLWEAVWNNLLLPMFGLEGDAMLAYDDPVPENNAERLAENTQALAGGWKTRNEVRRGEGLDDVEGGDELLVPQGLQTLAQALKGPAPLLPFNMPTAPAQKSVAKDADDPPPVAPPASDEAEPQTPTAAPNYRPAEIQGRNCGMCRFGTSDGWCSIYDFTYRSDMVCDAWAGKFNLDEVAPMPEAGEDKVTFITRCRADEKFRAVVADDDQRALACELIWDTKLNEKKQEFVTSISSVVYTDNDEVQEIAAGLPKLERVAQSDLLKCKIVHVCHCNKAVADPREGEVMRLVTGLRRELATIFGQQAAAIIEAMTGKKNAGFYDPTEIEKILASFQEPLRAALTEWLAPQVIAGGAYGLAQVAGDSAMWAVTNPAVEEWLRGYTMKLSGFVNQTSLQELSNTLADGVKVGESTGQLAARVNEVMNDGYRSEMIARTESARAFVRGEIQAVKESGLAQGRKWSLAVGGCDLCEAMARAFSKPVDVDAPFMRLGQTLAYGKGKVFVCDYADIYGGDAHPMDRCGCVWVTKEE